MGEIENIKKEMDKEIEKEINIIKERNKSGEAGKGEKKHKILEKL